MFWATPDVITIVAINNIRQSTMIQIIGTYSASMVHGILYLNTGNCGKIATTVRLTGFFPNCDYCEILVLTLFELFFSEKVQKFCDYLTQ